MLQMKRSDFVELVKNLKGALIVSLIAKTVPAMRKTGNPFMSVTETPFDLIESEFLFKPKKKKIWHTNCHKIAYINAIINWKYANAVNNQRAREGNDEYFKPEPRKWGKRIEGTAWVEHKGRMYLEVKVQRSLGHKYFDNAGQEIPREQVEPWLPKRKEGTRQEVDRPVILRDYALDSITQIKVSGEIYSLVD